MQVNQEKFIPPLDSESGSDRFAGQGKLVRQLKNRHVAMIRYADYFLPTFVIPDVPLSVLEVLLAQVGPSS